MLSEHQMAEGQTTLRWPQYAAALAATGGALAAGTALGWYVLIVMIFLIIY